MRAFTDADIVQHDKGTASAVGSVNVTLPQGVLDGNCGVICMASGLFIDSPSQWHRVAYPPPSGGAAFDQVIMLRAQFPAGESSWTFGFVAGAAHWQWTVDELANLAWAGPEGTSYTVDGAPAGSTISTGTASPIPGTWSDNTVGYATFGLYKQTTDAATWPAISYSNGFVQQELLTVGDASTAGDMLLAVARRFGTPGDPTTWECTATWTGGGPLTSVNAQAVLAVFGAVE